MPATCLLWPDLVPAAGAAAAAGRAGRSTYSPRAMQLAGVEHGLCVGLSFEVISPVAGERAVLQASS